MALTGNSFLKSSTDAFYLMKRNVNKFNFATGIGN